jgi:hypothetical protein
VPRDKTNWRHVDRGELVKPDQGNPVVYLLKDYGIPYDRIWGRYSTGDDFTLEKRFADYEIYFFGISSTEEIPHPQLAWQAEGEEYDCWQIRIYWKDYYGCIDAMWREDCDHYEVVTIWGSLGQLDMQTAAAMNEGMNLLFLVTQKMEIKKRGGDTRPEEIKRLWSNEDNLKIFAALVKNLAVDWEWIKSTYEPYSPDSSTWLQEMPTMRMFETMCSSYPKLTSELLSRVANNTLSPRDREPVALACVHAFHESGFADIYARNKQPEPTAETLRGYYEKGVALNPKP